MMKCYDITSIGSVGQLTDAVAKLPILRHSTQLKNYFHDFYSNFIHQQHFYIDYHEK